MDPEDVQGLAHFCEHMLFHGSEKYPSPKEFRTFVEHGGGRSNGWTSTDHTTYYFNTSEQYFEGALDRFCQLFASPLFSETMVDKEINAVHSEHTKNRWNDSYRRWRVETVLARHGHDYRKFITGNIHTLKEIPESKGKTLRGEVAKFYERHYSANLMTLCLVANKPLDEMEELVRKLDFHTIPNKNLNTKVWKPCYTQDESGHMVEVVSVNGTRELSLLFATKDFSAHYKSKPEEYLSHLLSHKAKGTLFSDLYGRSWIRSLSVFSKPTARGIGSFRIAMSLKPGGVEHVENIIETVFRHIGALKVQKPQKWIYDELAVIKKAAYLCSKEQNAIELSETLASVPFEDVLNHTLLEEFNPPLIHRLLDQLNPRNMNCVFLGSSVSEEENLETEEHYGVRYKKTRFTKDQMKKFQSALDFPDQNAFVPERNEYIPELIGLDNAKEDLQILRNDGLCRVWHKCVRKHKVNISLFFMFPGISADPSKSYLLKHYVECFQKANETNSAYAKAAGIVAEIKSSMAGINIICNGFDAKVARFAVELLEKLVAFQASYRSFRASGRCQARSTENPYESCWSLLDEILSEKSWSHEDLAACSSKATIRMLNRFIAQLWSTFHLEVCCYGSVGGEQTEEFVENILKAIRKVHARIIPLSEERLPRNCCLRIPEGTSLVHDTLLSVHEDSAVLVYLQLGVDEPRNHVTAELLVHIANPLAFAALRTFEQLGYCVLTQESRNNGAIGLAITVQSCQSLKYVEGRIEVFLKNLRDQLGGMSNDEFEKHLQTLKSKYEIPDSNRPEMQYSEFRAAQAKRNLSELRELTKEEFLLFFDEKITKDSPKRQKLTVFIRSTRNNQNEIELADSVGDDRTHISNIKKFKASSSFYPAPKRRGLCWDYCGKVTAADLMEFPCL
ncbi:hypothetical protein L596_024005 [Steinernema carpocapsae]|uniref:Peptidase M16 N-terminal domain-containing protein n=1 Tax=Steinernema carpocapsae TaxID=34508 RepID=A0A4V5ZZR4_STECR|nr:hypothetical protein L596_024005 [Steinernema carpocapsae]